MNHIDHTTCPICHSDKHKLRSPEETKSLINRLKRIEGQVRGVQSMIESDAYCPDVMRQVAAIRAALASFNRCLLDDHVRTCVTEGITHGDEDVTEELITLLHQLMK